jgi:hypothetical protein
MSCLCSLAGTLHGRRRKDRGRFINAPTDASYAGAQCHGSSSRFLAVCSSYWSGVPTAALACVAPPPCQAAVAVCIASPALVAANHSTVEVPFISASVADGASAAVWEVWRAGRGHKGEAVASEAGAASCAGHSRRALCSRRWASRKMQKPRGLGSKDHTCNNSSNGLRWQLTAL